MCRSNFPENHQIGIVDVLRQPQRALTSAQRRGKAADASFDIGRGSDQDRRRTAQALGDDPTASGAANRIDRRNASRKPERTERQTRLVSGYGFYGKILKL